MDSYKDKSQIQQKMAVLITVICFLFSTIFPSMALAQVASGLLSLPPAGQMVELTPEYSPVMIKGLQLVVDDPLNINFIIDSGSAALTPDELKIESQKLIKYFLASLTVSQDQMWVNLSPYEKNRIIPQEFGLTEMGQDLLAQDYMLKQLSASLMNPEQDLGEVFWANVRGQAQEQFGISDMAVNTFNKIWIVPQRAQVLIHNNMVFVEDCYLRVMMEEDYLALAMNQGSTRHGLGDVGQADLKSVDDVSTPIVREIIIPLIEKEVNQGQTFANLRQIFHSMILAYWYKQNLKNSLLGQKYIDQYKTQGLENQDPAVNQKIYQQYLAAFKTGVFDFIKEEYDPAKQQFIARKYFSGGVDSAMLGTVLRENNTSPLELLTAFRGPALFTRVMLRAPSDKADFSIQIVEDTFFSDHVDSNEPSFRALVAQIEPVLGSEKFKQFTSLISPQSQRGRFFRESFQLLYQSGFLMQQQILRAFFDLIFNNQANMDDTLHILEHSMAVTRMALLIAQHVDLNTDQIEEIIIAGLIHDLGKLSDDSNVLHNSIKSLHDMSEAERFLTVNHEEAPREILAEYQIDITESVMDIVRGSSTQQIKPDSDKSVAVLFIADQFTARSDLHRAYIVEKLKTAELFNINLTTSALIERVYRAIDADQKFQIQGILRELYDHVGSMIEREDPKVFDVLSYTHYRLPKNVEGDASQSNLQVRGAESPSKDLKGGIDLNPAALQLQTKGETLDFHFPLADTDSLKDIEINGLVPMIINITPINNIPLFLGMKESRVPQISGVY